MHRIWKIAKDFNVKNEFIGRFYKVVGMEEKNEKNTGLCEIKGSSLA